MRQIKSQMKPFERISREPEHNFFGYYDLQPWSGDGLHHLCHRVKFMDRMPAATDQAELGMIRISDYQFIPLASTYAWNFQQGSMLQWHPCNTNRGIIYNSYHLGAFKGVIKNIITGEIRLLPRPLANVSPDGKFGLSVNFSRMFDFRPGYGYAGILDPYGKSPAPEEDGIFLVDLESGKDKLIISFSALAKLFSEKYKMDMNNVKLLINHITFNPSGDRFVFLMRNMPMAGMNKDCGWLTLTGTADISGENIHILKNHFAASHYIWRDNEHLLIYADMQGPWKLNLCLVKDQSAGYEIIEPDFFTFDGHCSYSPDKRFILYDSYPDKEGYRQLLLYDIQKKRGMQLANLLSSTYFLPDEDIRCDLHPRWNRDGSAISFDSTHEGHRHVYCMDMRDF